MNHRLKTWLILLSGFLTGIFSFFIPVGGGGVSLIFVLTVPFFIILGIIFGVIHDIFVRKIRNIHYKNGIFLTMLAIIITLTFMWYPYQ